MPQFTVDLDVLRHALRDAALSQVGDSLLQTKITSPLKISGITFTPSADFAVRVFNGAADKDAADVFGDDAGAPIPFALQSAWVKYTLAARAAAKVGFAPAELQASRDLVLSDYRLHDPADKAWDALRNDLSSPRTLLELDDVKKLKPGEALAMELGGALSASVSFSWSDVFSTHLADILSEVPASVPIPVKVKSGATATASVKVTDQFSVVISRTRDGHFRFSVKKAKSRNHTYGLDVSLGVELNAAPAIDDAVLGPLVDAVAKKAPQVPLDKLRASLVKNLEKAAAWKASTGFAYEYARIDENSSIADFILLDDARLEDDYELVLDGNFAKIAEELRADTGARSLVRYLNEATTIRRSSFGFSLGLGKWALKTTDESVLTQTTRTSLDGFQLITCNGTRKYEEKNIPQNDFEWVVDFKAQMSEFVEHPTTLDFDCGLHVLATLERGAFSSGDLARMLDFAAMWDVNVPTQDELAEALGKKGSIRVQLVLEHDALAAALAQNADVALWAEPLAMAMPSMSSFPERRTFASRRNAYARAFGAWLGGGTQFPLDVQSGITLFEKQGGAGSFEWTVGEGHPQLRRRLDSFVAGARKLHAAMTTAQQPAELGDAYAALSQFWSQRLYVAAAGRWLLDRARDANAPVKRSMQIDLGDDTITV